MIKLYRSSRILVRVGCRVAWTTCGVASRDRGAHAYACVCVHTHNQSGIKLLVWESPVQSSTLDPEWGVHVFSAADVAREGENTPLILEVHYAKKKGKTALLGTVHTSIEHLTKSVSTLRAPPCRPTPVP